MTKSTSVFKENTQAILKKAIAIGILGGALWGSAFAADQTNNSIPVTMSTPTTAQSTPVTPSKNTTTSHQQDNTFYDRLVAARADAHSQTEANAAIFLTRNTPSTHTTRPNAPTHAVPTAQQGEATYQYGKLHEPNNNQAAPNDGPREFKANNRQGPNEAPHFQNRRTEMPPMKSEAPRAVPEAPQMHDNQTPQITVEKAKFNDAGNSTPDQMAKFPPRVPATNKNKDFMRNGERPIAFIREGERSDDTQPNNMRQNRKPRFTDERPEGFNPPNKHHDGFKHDGERPDNFKHDGERPDNFKHDGERPDNFKHDGERPDNFKHDGERPDNIKHDGENRQHNKHHASKANQGHHDDTNNGNPSEHPDFPNNGNRPDNQ